MEDLAALNFSFFVDPEKEGPNQEIRARRFSKARAREREGNDEGRVYRGRKRLLGPPREPTSHS